MTTRNGATGISQPTGWFALVAVLFALASCSECGTRKTPVGRMVAPGQIRLLEASPRGDVLAWMEACTPVAGSDESLCDVKVFAEGEVQTVGSRASLTSGLRWSREGDLAVLASYSTAHGAGDLTVWNVVGGVQFVASGTTAFEFAAERTLIYVSNAELRAWRVTGPYGSMLILPSARSFAVNPSTDTSRARALAVGRNGELFSIARDWTARPLGIAGVREYAVAPTGRFAVAVAGPRRDLYVTALDQSSDARVLGPGVASYAIAPDGELIAFVGDEESGSVLHVASPDGAPEEIARDVQEFAWATESPVLAWMASPRRELGVLVMRDGKEWRSIVAHDVRMFTMDPKGVTLAYLTETRATPSEARKLGRNALYFGYVAALGPPLRQASVGEARTIGVWPDGSGVVYLNCPPGETPCNLMSQAAPRGECRAEVHKLCGLVYGFKIGNRRDRVIVEYCPTGFEPRGWAPRPLLALSDPSGILIDVGAAAESVVMLPPSFDAVAYVVDDPKRAGVYVAQLGNWGERKLDVCP